MTNILYKGDSNVIKGGFNATDRPLTKGFRIRLPASLCVLRNWPCELALSLIFLLVVSVAASM